MAVQMLAALSGATILVTDMKEDAMKAVEQFGGVPVAGGEGQADRIHEATKGHGVTPCSTSSVSPRPSSSR